jgi:uncharacterized membrane protein YbhN (UPF0104 family)
MDMADVSPVTSDRVNPQFVYQTIREEIIDQKHCQFQLLSLAVTVTAGVIAYGTRATAAPPVYLAPLVMNVLAIVIILDKAVSIQRKVGYLQLMEEGWGKCIWMWERQLDEFRKAVPERTGVAGDPPRKHSYVTTVGWMLVLLNSICVFLYVAAPGAWEWHVDNFPWLSLMSAAMVMALSLFGAIAFFVRRSDLVAGRHSGPQIRKTWEGVLVKWKSESEAPRDCRRRNSLRGWSHGKTKQVLPRSAGTSGSDGVRERA